MTDAPAFGWAETFRAAGSLTGSGVDRESAPERGSRAKQLKVQVERRRLNKAVWAILNGQWGRTQCAGSVGASTSNLGRFIVCYLMRVPFVETLARAWQFAFVVARISTTH